MKIVFFGTPDYILPILTKIHHEFVTGPGTSPIAGVVTASPKPVGRKQYLSYSPIDKWAHEHKVPTFYSANELLDANLDIELGVLASYGEIITQEVINLFPQGILVIHPSLLPKYRGASPVPAAIKNGDEKTGVTILKMDSKMDHGPIITQFKEDILESDTSDVLRDRLFEKSAQVLIETLTPYMQGKIKLKKQDEDEATYTKLVTKQDGFIDLKEKSATEAERFIRAMFPWPGAWTYLPNEKRLKFLRSHVEDGKLVLDEVQLEGKLPVPYKQFKEAYKDFKLG
ncbi:MAG TPA: methionyl-tRNA formyltransferase [Patescibacteria group bacterium]|nr:methionyl-tRNA formyltransferase [Patescibacteria group bacterium]